MDSERPGRRVAVCMSGGVDSAVAAALLVEQGYLVTGVTMRVWKGIGSAVAGRHGCYGPSEVQDIEDAGRVARRLGINHVLIDLAAEYEAQVLDYVRRQYRTGKTPNPCVVCNERLKFGRLLERLGAGGHQWDYVASGHYARIERPQEGPASAQWRFELKKALDKRKDQTYFLYRLPRRLLSRILFPLGSLRKEEVRRKALELALPVAKKPESQDFADAAIRATILGNLSAPGPIVDEQGNTLGTHRGIHHYTVGQRHRLGIAARHPLYVLRLEPVTRTVVVGPAERLLAKKLYAEEVNWLVDQPDSPLRASASIRYSHPPAAALITPLSRGRLASGSGSVQVEFDGPQAAVTPGQSVVFYAGDKCLGGGIITSCTDAN